MAAPVPLRDDFDAAALRMLARKTRDASQARRLLALAEVYDGGSRGKAARIGGVGRQTVRDWVLRFSATTISRSSDCICRARPTSHPTRQNGDARNELKIEGVDEIYKSIEEAEKKCEAAVDRINAAKKELEILSGRSGTFFFGEQKYTDALEKLLRYEAAIDRSLSRAQDQLARRQRERHDKAAARATVIDAEIDTEEASG